ncbi:vacuolar import and degradation protein-domain-containing protein [Dipodascopsis tothii]|uniref:vacuolar import and degradation protein-domain-containing protein n=1 Tax=Dipodascopsis tothii TaxID=44089 RepID=UPI0034CD2F7F
MAPLANPPASDSRPLRDAIARRNLWNARGVSSRGSDASSSMSWRYGSDEVDAKYLPGSIYKSANEEQRRSQYLRDLASSSCASAGAGDAAMGDTVVIDENKEPTPAPLAPRDEVLRPRRNPPYSSSTYLRSGSHFVGTQQSGRSTYEVHVELKHVDMRESFVCGYLHIQGLTEDHPTLTTYFEGQIIGPKYSFLTRRSDWGATEKTDVAHWARFPSWRPLAGEAKRPDYCHNDFDQRDHIYMRWKECFLVPDHKIRNINGASFAGFYYICFSQLNGAISGLYYHASSEKYQQLELRHTPDKGSYYSYEFR